MIENELPMEDFYISEPDNVWWSDIEILYDKEENIAWYFFKLKKSISYITCTFTVKNNNSNKELELLENEYLKEQQED